jgi:peptidoglycan/LPS O-acetylase OafA/YrhL
MTNALSLYLDVLRFGAAFTVFLSHYAAARYSGGLLWRLMPYGRTAVLVFFVLSGFVIAWVTETRERSLKDYALSRTARLYSVILPAFLVTAVVDHLAIAIDPGLYGPQLRLSASHSLLSYVLSAVFVGQSWALTMIPGSDIPFWSLNYEAWYYVLFAAAVFLRGRRRIVVLAAATLLAGPKILILFPIWLMGVAAFRWRAALAGSTGARLAFGSLAAFIVIEALGGHKLFPHAETPWLPFSYSAYDYIVGALVALFIVGLAKAPLPVPGIAAQRLIRWLAGTTFGVYLLHYPLLNFFGTVVPGSADTAMHALLVFGLTLGGSIALARVTEQRKGALKRALRSGLDALHRRYLRPAFERPTV